jgi:6-phosphogluconolactonase
MSEAIELRVFKHRLDASVAAADLLAGLLAPRLAEGPMAEASLVVSGGTSPGPCFNHLSVKVLDWSRVTIVPSDERWVPGDDPESNERLIRHNLLKNEARRSSFLSFYRSGISPQQAPPLIERDLMMMEQPFTAVLLGMGEDGHFASLFPDYEGLPEALDPDGKSRCVMVRTAGSPHMRISLTLSAMLASERIVLLIFGEAKRAVFEAASNGEGNYPVEALVKNTRCPVTVFWAP